MSVDFQPIMCLDLRNVQMLQKDSKKRCSAINFKTHANRREKGEGRSNYAKKIHTDALNNLHDIGKCKFLRTIIFKIIYCNLAVTLFVIFNFIVILF